MCHVHELNDARDVSQIRADWDRLLEQTDGATFVHSAAWFEAWWRRFGGGARLRLLVVEDVDRPIGIVPLAVRRLRTPLGRLPVLQYACDGPGCFCGPVGPDGLHVLSRALEHLRDGRRDWAMLELSGVDKQRRDRRSTPSALTSAGLAAIESPASNVWVTDLAGTYEDFLVHRSKHWRKIRRKSEEKLASLGEVRFVRHRPPPAARGQADPSWELFAACEAIAARLHAETLDGSAGRPDVLSFLREVHEPACAAGAADLSVLFVGERPAAFSYGVHHRGTVEAIWTELDPVLGEAAAMVLFDRMLRDSYARGDGALERSDPLAGDHSLEAGRRIVTYRYCHYRAGALRAQLLNLLRTWGGRFRSAGPAPVPARATWFGAAAPTRRARQG
jgi:CelD/BcsL family acetyltransferase involved in cellulose biosynthesis